jgi:hypothetical protein
MRGERETHTTAEESCSEETARFRSSCFFCVDGGFSFSAVFALLCCLPFLLLLKHTRRQRFLLSFACNNSHSTSIAAFAITRISVFRTSVSLSHFENRCTLTRKEGDKKSTVSSLGRISQAAGTTKL